MRVPTTEWLSMTALVAGKSGRNCCTKCIGRSHLSASSRLGEYPWHGAIRDPDLVANTIHKGCGPGSPGQGRVEGSCARAVSEGQRAAGIGHHLAVDVAIEL